MIALIQLHLEKELGINHLKTLQKFAEHIIFLYESPYVKEFHFVNWLQEKNMETFFKVEEIEKVEELKMYLKTWYQNKKEKPDLVRNKSDVKTLKEYRYLLNEADKKEVIKQVEEELRKDIELIKKEKKARPSRLQEDELNKIKEKLVALRTF